MKQVTFSLPAEALGDATEALLLGDFNNWNPAEAVVLSVQKDGTLKAELLLEAGRTYEYRYLLNNGTWINDWAAESYTFKSDLNVENSVITIPGDIVIVEETVVAISEAPAKAAKKAKATAPKKAVAKKAAAPKKEVAKTKTPVKDDLTKIEGIGPKIAKLLEAEGIIGYKDLSKATVKTLKAVLEAAGPKFKMHNPSSWSKQAKLAAAGSWEELKKLQEQLVAGK